MKEMNEADKNGLTRNGYEKMIKNAVNKKCNEMFGNLKEYKLEACTILLN